MIADDEVTKNINFVRKHSNRRLKSNNMTIYCLMIIFRQPNSPAMFAIHYGDHFPSCPSVSAYVIVCSESHVIIMRPATPAIVRRYNRMPHDRHPHSRWYWAIGKGHRTTIMFHYQVEQDERDCNRKHTWWINNMTTRPVVYMLDNHFGNVKEFRLAFSMFRVP